MLVPAFQHEHPSTTGGGLFVAIAPFSGSLFDRLVAASDTQGTSVFLVFFADGLACK
jgi:hypothetical protein